VGYALEINIDPISENGMGSIFHLDDEYWERFEKKERGKA